MPAGAGGETCARSGGGVGGVVTRARRQITLASRGFAADSAEERGRGPNASPAEEGRTIAWGATERSSSKARASASEMHTGGLGGGGHRDPRAPTDHPRAERRAASQQRSTVRARSRGPGVSPAEDGRTIARGAKERSSSTARASASEMRAGRVRWEHRDPPALSASPCRSLGSARAAAAWPRRRATQRALDAKAVGGVISRTNQVIGGGRPKGEFGRKVIRMSGSGSSSAPCPARRPIGPLKPRLRLVRRRGALPAPPEHRSEHRAEQRPVLCEHASMP